MLRNTLAAAALLASAAYAQLPVVSPATNESAPLVFTNPISGSTWMYSQNETIRWNAPREQDPQNVSLLIVNAYNQSLLPNYPTPLALNIFSNVTEFSMENISLPVAHGYIILMVDINNSSNIFSQGGFFNVSESDTTNPQGTGFSVASTTTIVSGGPAGGVAMMNATAAPFPVAVDPVATTTAAPLRLGKRHRQVQAN